MSRVCFSIQADIAAAAVLGVVAVPCLLSVRHRQEVLFAALPLLFAAHQFIEIFVWRELDSSMAGGATTTRSTAALLYVVFALPFLPTYVPLAVTLLEPPEKRRRVLPFLGLGMVVTAYFTYALVANGPVATMETHAINYSVNLAGGYYWALLYVVATVGPPIFSGYRSVVAFGVLNLIGLVTVAILYLDAFASLWCFYCAALSVMVLIHLRRRHRYLDVQGRPLPGHRVPADPVYCT